MLGQNEVDALRYSQTFIGGTARSVSMGGAFGSLGGDYSSIVINPAALGIYRSSEFTITPAFYFDQTSANFINSKNNDIKYNFNLNNLGLIGAYSSDETEGWIGAGCSFGYNRLNNFQ